MKIFFLWMTALLTYSSAFSQNVGISTTSPVFRLDVRNGSINTDSVYRIGSKIILSTPETANLFAGENAGKSNTDGDYNSFFGGNTGFFNTSGNNNSFFGLNSGFNNTIGGGNSFFGLSSGHSNAIGNLNSFFGQNAGYGNTSGGTNSFFGYSAGFSNSTGYSNTAVGYLSDFSGLLTNATALGANAKVDCSNCMVLGSVNTINGADASVNVGIGVNAPTAKLSISTNGTELAGIAAGNTLRTNAGTLSNTINSEISMANIGFLSPNNSSLGIKAYRTSSVGGWETTSILLGMDVDNTKRVGAGFLAIGSNGNIGISTFSPAFSLSFPPVLGDKISLWSNSTNSYGFGIQSGQLQIHTDISAADIVFGFGSSASLNQTMIIKGNGNVGIGSAIPSATAALDVNSTTKGFLPPRMTKAQGDAISNPVPGLIIWCTNCGTNGELNVYNGTAWTNMIGNPAGQVLAPPTVITTAISGINSTSAISGGNVTSDGYVAVTSRGVCWNIATNPTIALSTKTNNGPGTGIYESNITGLMLGVTYFARSYATNAIGTSYGTEFSFTTAFGPGDPYQGGIVAYISQPGDPGYIAGQTHGLIAASEDSYDGFGTEWGCEGINIPGANSTALGTGNQNTIDIMAGCSTAGIAARLCGDLTFNGYSDWYLPSIDELYKLYINQAAIGGFYNDRSYWSSSEADADQAWQQSVFSHAIYPTYKYSTGYVRAVRSF